LKLGKDKKGYQIVKFKHNYKGHLKSVARLVAEAFLGPSCLTVNHKNCKKTDNRILNLEYLSHRENMFHAYENGRLHTRKSKWKPKNSKDLNELKGRILFLKQKGKTIREIAKTLGIHYTSVQNISKNKIFYFKETKQ
jgi:hypothetical protein